MLFHEPRHIVGPATAARLLDDRQRGITRVGQDDRAVAGLWGHVLTNAEFFDLSQLRLVSLR